VSTRILCSHSLCVDLLNKMGFSCVFVLHLHCTCVWKPCLSMPKWATHLGLKLIIDLKYSWLLTAQQEAQRAQFWVEKAIQERQQKIVQAEGEAKAATLISFSMLILSQCILNLCRFGLSSSCIMKQIFVGGRGGQIEDPNLPLNVPFKPSCHPHLVGPWLCKISHSVV